MSTTANELALHINNTVNTLSPLTHWEESIGSIITTRMIILSAINTQRRYHITHHRSHMYSAVQRQSHNYWLDAGWPLSRQHEIPRLFQ